MNTTKRSALTTIIITLVIGILTIVVPITWDLIKSKSAIELQMTSKSVIIEKGSNLDELKVFYGDQEVDKLTKFSFLLLNTGRKPILETDLVSLPRIRFQGKSKILNTSLSDASVENINAQVKSSDDGKEILLSFPLLNSRDYFAFTVLVDGENPTFSCDARIKNIRELSFVDRSVESPKKKHISAGVYVIGFFTFIFSIIPFTQSKEIKREKEAKARFDSANKDDFPTQNKNDWIAFISHHFDYLSSSEKSGVLNALKYYPENDLPADMVQMLNEQVIKLRKEESGNLPAVVMISIFALAGWWYVIKTLVDYWG